MRQTTIHSGTRRDSSAGGVTGAAVTTWSLGVDLGTSFSAGAVASAGRAEVLEVGGERRVPSTVVLAEDGQLLAGTFARRMVGRYPDRAERNPKRYVGRGSMVLGGEQVDVRRALAALLELFVGEARRRFDGTAPSSVVLTHPVAWGTDRRDLLRDAAERVLPEVPVTLLDEPVAAAVHYAHDHALAIGDSVAVYDLGGGTFDAAVLASARDGFRVVGRPGGDPDIGGESFDERVYAHFGEQLALLAPEWWKELGSNPDRRWLAASAELLTEARLAKESLSEYETAAQYIPGADADVHLTRAELDDLIRDDVRRTADILAEVVAVAQLRPDQLRGVFLTGGASRGRLVEQTLRETYGPLVRTWQDPKTVVALGAALWAARNTPGVAVGTAAPGAAAAGPGDAAAVGGHTGAQPLQPLAPGWTGVVPPMERALGAATGAYGAAQRATSQLGAAAAQAGGRAARSVAGARAAGPAAVVHRVLRFAPAIVFAGGLLLVIMGMSGGGGEVTMSVLLVVLAAVVGAALGAAVHPQLTMSVHPVLPPVIGAVLWALGNLALTFVVDPDGGGALLLAVLLWASAATVLVGRRRLAA
jgi:actin-like ATPase involved in cell morphogenesis